VELGAELARAAEICRRGREAVMSVYHEARMGRALDVEGCLPLVEEITASVLRHPGALVSLARLKTQDDYTYLHSMAVCALMVALARQLGHDESACRAAGVAGLMHDVGKALMPERVLNKPGSLSAEEMAVMRTHPERGHALLLQSRGAAPQTLDVALHHHEKMDGSGYPHRLQGEQISLLARMGAVCDVYDAITSNRPYKNGWDPAQSLSRMASWKGHFDAAVFAAFVRSLGIYPLGSLVRLASGRLAVVTDQNPGALVAPVVRVFHALAGDRALPPQRLDLSRPGCDDRIVARESLAEHRFGNLDALWLDPDLQRRALSSTD
jgi:putative nucleotidyltransferase with HDIG domain